MPFQKRCLLLYNSAVHGIKNFSYYTLPYSACKKATKCKQAMVNEIFNVVNFIRADLKDKKGQNILQNVLPLLIITK